MVEIQCSSCHTRYRIDEKVLPEETPTFKCSRCGHVFSIEPRPASGDPKIAVAKKPETPRKGPQARARRALKAAKPVPPANEIEAPKPAATRIQPPAIERAQPPDPHPSEHVSQPAADPLERPFSGSEPDSGEESRPGENMSFDFSAESDEKNEAQAHLTPDADDEDGWEVGESPLNFAAESADRTADDSPGIESAAFEAPSPQRGEVHEFIPPDVAALSLGRAVHSSGFFMAWFFFVALGFGASSLVISGDPTASAALLAKLPGLGDHFVNPVSPAVMVALRDVHAEYQPINGQRAALVIAGQALNVGSLPLHEVQIAVSLLDGAQQELAKQAVDCGNSLPNRMIGQMTSRELQFFQRLSPPKTFVLQPSASYPFVIVFVEPPARAARFAIQVARAQPGAAAAASDGVAATPGL